MTLIPLDIPAGVYKNGTDLEGQGRWQDASLVRWKDNTLRPVGGWLTRVAEAIPASTQARGMHSWESNGGTRYYAIGCHNKAFAGTGNNTITDITPATFTAGDVHPSLQSGYGAGAYGAGPYGTERSNYGSYEEVNTWAFDNFGELLVACAYSDGKLLEWDLNPSNNLTAITNAPTNNLGLVVTEERIIFALGASGNPRQIKWCDIEDRTAWTAAATNQAGDIELQTSGQIMQGIRTRGQVLILTDIDAHVARYSGPPFIYGFQRVGTACGAISRKVAVDTDAGAFWMGHNGFFRFDGNIVQEIPCSVHDHVFGEVQGQNKTKAWCFSNIEHSEVWWFYQSTAQDQTSGEIDKYVVYNYEENWWSIGELSRTSGLPRGVFARPFMMEGRTIYEHEATEGATNMYAETGPIQLGAGDNIMHVTQFIGDERSKGDVQVKFKSRYYPNGDETEHGPFDPATPTGIRVSGRQIKMRVEPDDGTNFRVGIMRLDAQQGGKR